MLIYTLKTILNEELCRDRIKPQQEVIRLASATEEYKAFVLFYLRFRGT